MTARKKARGVTDIRLGPLLYARGPQGGRWRVSATILVGGDAEPPDLRVEGVGLAVPPRWLAALDGGHLWRFDFAVPRAVQDTRVGYRLEGEERDWFFTAPGTAVPLRLALAAGTDGVGDDGPGLWGGLLGRHRAEPFHILLDAGGPADEARAADSRRTVWAQAEPAAILASLPMLCLPEHVGGTTDVEARRVQRLFRCAMDGEPPETMPDAASSATQALVVGRVGLLALDMDGGGGDTSGDAVLSAETWEKLPGWLERFRGCDRLLLLTAPPLALPRFALADRLLRWLPGRERLERALRGTWRAPGREEAWRRMIRLLSGFTRETGCAVTVLSGDGGFGAAGVIHGLGLDIGQVIVGNLGRTPPGAFVLDRVERAADGLEAIVDGLELEMLRFLPTGRAIVRERNWVALTVEPDGALDVAWHAEGHGGPLRADAGSHAATQTAGAMLRWRGRT